MSQRTITSQATTRNGAIEIVRAFLGCPKTVASGIVDRAPSGFDMNDLSRVCVANNAGCYYVQIKLPA